MFGRRGREQRPDVGDCLLVGLRKILEFLHYDQYRFGPGRRRLLTNVLQLVHGWLISLSSAFQVWSMPVAVLRTGIGTVRSG